jgi:hypothetical protein
MGALRAKTPRLAASTPVRRQFRRKSSGGRPIPDSAFERRYLAWQIAEKGWEEAEDHTVRQREVEQAKPNAAETVPRRSCAN